MNKELFDKENADNIYSLVLKNAPGYTEDMYELAKGSLMGALMAYEKVETCTFDTLDQDITDLIYDRQGRFRVSPTDMGYMRILRDVAEWREDLYTGAKQLLQNVLTENEPYITDLYANTNIRDINIPVFTQNRILVLVSGVRT